MPAIVKALPIPLGTPLSTIDGGTAGRGAIIGGIGGRGGIIDIGPCGALAIAGAPCGGGLPASRWKALYFGGCCSLDFGGFGGSGGVQKALPSFAGNSIPRPRGWLGADWADPGGIAGIVGGVPVNG